MWFSWLKVFWSSLAICPKVLWTPSFWSVMTYSLFSLVFIYVFVFKQPPCYLQMNLWKSKCKEVENVFTVSIMVYLFINSFVNDTLEGTMILNSQAIIHLVLWLRLVIFSDWKIFCLPSRVPLPRNHGSCLNSGKFLTHWPPPPPAPTQFLLTQKPALLIFKC